MAELSQVGLGYLGSLQRLALTGAQAAEREALVAAVRAGSIEEQGFIVAAQGLGAKFEPDRGQAFNASLRRFGSGPWGISPIREERLAPEAEATLVAMADFPIGTEDGLNLRFGKLVEPLTVYLGA